MSIKSSKLIKTIFIIIVAVVGLYFYDTPIYKNISLFTILLACTPFILLLNLVYLFTKGRRLRRFFGVTSIIVAVTLLPILLFSVVISMGYSFNWEVVFYLIGIGVAVALLAAGIMALRKSNIKLSIWLGAIGYAGVAVWIIASIPKLLKLILQ